MEKNSSQCDLDFTGERVIPGKVDQALWNEHISRYIFAADFVEGKVVLDAGCGVGYGADLLAAWGGQKVLGVDKSSEAIAYAQSHYKRENLEFRVADVSTLNLEEKRFDVVVALEVIEHLKDQARFLMDVTHILKDEGLFIVSTPNKEANPTGCVNSFHTREFAFEEFQGLLTQYFRRVEVLAQNYTLGIAIGPPGLNKVLVDHSLTNEENPSQYLLALCGQVSFRPLREAQKLFLFSRDRNECLNWESVSRDKRLRKVRTLVADRKFEEAIACSSSYSQTTDPPEWNYLIGFCLHMLRRDLERARDLYTESLEQGFDEFWVRFNRGSLFAQLDNTEQARADLERAVELNPNHPGARELLSMLMQPISVLQPREPRPKSVDLQTQPGAKAGPVLSLQRATSQLSVRIQALEAQLTDKDACISSLQEELTSVYNSRRWRLATWMAVQYWRMRQLFNFKQRRNQRNGGKG